MSASLFNVNMEIMLCTGMGSVDAISVEKLIAFTGLKCVPEKTVEKVYQKERFQDSPDPPIKGQGER